MINRRFLGRIVVVVAVAGMLHSPPAFAQEPGPATEPGARPAVASASVGEPDSNSADKRAASPQAANATFSYYMVSGTTMKPRSSSLQFDYGNTGCTHATSGSDFFNTELQLPDGAVIKYIRVYYIDTNNASSATGFLTRYEPGTAASDLVSAGSTPAFNGGFGFTISSEITETVDNSKYAYALLGLAPNATAKLCGIRVAYYAPPIWAAFTPAILRQTP